MCGSSSSRSSNVGMPCSACGSPIECPYVVEWVGAGHDDADDRPAPMLGRRRGSMSVAVPFTTRTQSHVGIVDIPMGNSCCRGFWVDPELWDATSLAMVARRRESAPCLARETPETFWWLTIHLMKSLFDYADMTLASGACADCVGCVGCAGSGCAPLSLTAAHASYAARRLRLSLYIRDDVDAAEKEKRKAHLITTDMTTKRKDPDRRTSY